MPTPALCAAGVTAPGRTTSDTGSTRCPHCQQEAVYIIRARHAGQIMVLPVCEPHFEDCLQCWDPEATWVPVDPVYDADIDDLYAT